METNASVRAQIAEHKFPLLFASVSGAHLYGFTSPDSDWDLRGVHVLPVSAVLGLLPLEETIEFSGWRDGVELDLVTHDVRKFFSLLLTRNGYVLEQLFSPLVLAAAPEFEELKELARGCITSHHSHHYFGFAETQWKLFEKEQPRRVKPLLYVYRVLLTGIHLMKSGVVESNLARLNEEYQLPQLADLMARKQAGPEQSTLANDDLDFHAREYARLRAQLAEAEQATQLPAQPSSRAALNDLLVRVRMRMGAAQS